MTLAEDMLRMAFEHARRVLVEGADTHKELVPVYAIMAHGELSIIATPWRNDHEKRLAQFLIRSRINADGANAYSFVSEAWMVLIDPKVAKWDGRKPSQSEARIEVVTAVAVAKTDSGLDKRMQSWEIMRNGQGRIVDLKPMEKMSGADAVGGNMPSLLDD